MSTQDIVQGSMCEKVRKGYPSVADEELNHERPPAVDSDDGQFEVERLIGKRRVGRSAQYQRLMLRQRIASRVAARNQ